MAYNSLNQYVLFSSDSPAKTRAWSRFAGLACGNQEKLKYTVLKNPPATVPGPVRGCASRATTVDVAGRTYGIDPAIFQTLLQLLQTNPAATLRDLQARIAEARVLVNRPPPLGVQLRKFPLARYKPRTTYLAGSNKWGDVVRPMPRNFQFKAGAPIDVVIENFPLIMLYEHFYLKRKFKLQNAQYVYVANNGGCGYTGRVADLVSAASDNGKAIQALQTSPFTFTPIACLMQPANPQYPIKFGLLLAVNSQTVSVFDFPAKDLVLEAVSRNSEFIFIPAQTELEIIENKDLPVGMGVTFPLTNGGFFRRDFIDAYNGVLAKFFMQNPAFKTLRSNVAAFAPQLVFPLLNAILA